MAPTKKIGDLFADIRKKIQNCAYYPVSLQHRNEVSHSSEAVISIKAKAKSSKELEL
jgi:hypothetical protein